MKPKICGRKTRLLVIVHACCCQIVLGLPMFLVNSGRPKCMTVEAPGQTVIKIHYEAPDIDTKDSPGFSNYSPTYITLLETPVDTMADRNDQSDGERQQLKRSPTPVSQELTQYHGSFLQRIHHDAQVDVCIRASMASRGNPMRFHLRVEDVGDADTTAAELEQNALGADHHWSFLEMQLYRIEHEMHAIIAEADFFRERDAVYHQQTDDLHKTTTFWPILHVGILLITGFTQANHIVHFFQSRRIL